MGHVLHAWLYLLGTEAAALPVARTSYERALELPHNDREARHLQALRQLLDGRWHAAGRVLEDLSIDYPHDMLALQAGQQIDFFPGDARMLRDRISRAILDRFATSAGAVKLGSTTLQLVEPDPLTVRLQRPEPM